MYGGISLEHKTDNLVKKTLIYLAGNFSSKIFGFIIIPIYATYLSASQLGEYDFQQTIAGLLQPVIALAIWEAVLRFGLKAEKKELNQIISTAAFISCGTLSIAFIIMLGMYFNIYGTNIISFLYVLMIIFMPIITLLGYMTRATRNTAVFAFSGVISSFINLLGILVFVIWKDFGLMGMLLSTIAANICNALSLFLGSKLYNYISFRNFSRKQAIILLTYSMPLILNLVFGWFTSSFSRFYINTTIGSTENGIYAFAMKFSTIILQISSIVNMTMIEDAVETAGAENWTKRFEKNIVDVTNIFFRAAFIFLPLIGIYFHTVTNNDFSKSLVLVPILMYSTLMNNASTLIGNVFSVFNKTSRIFLTTLLSGFVNILGAVALGHLFGLWGIIISQILGSSVLFFTRYFYGRSINRYEIDWKKMIINSLLFLLVSLIVLTRNLWIQFIVFFISSSSVCFLYKNWIKYEINQIRNKLNR